MGRASPPLSPYSGHAGFGKKDEAPAEVPGQRSPRSKPDDRFKMGGPPPGIQVQYGSMELDAYGQPLSPTNMLSQSPGKPVSTAQTNQQADSKPSLPGHLLSAPQGAPRLTGLSSLEYTPENGGMPSSLQYFGCSFNQKQSSILDASNVDKYTSLTKHGQQTQASNEVASHANRAVDEESQANTLMEVCVNLPAGLLVEQVEVRFHDDQRAKVCDKYLKLVGVTKRSMIRKEALEYERKVGDDVQITVDELDAGQRMKAKYLKLRNGHYDSAKHTYELNYVGNACHQINIQFEFDKAQALELIEQCKGMVMQSKQGLKQNSLDQADPGKASQTHSQLMSSSYGNDFCYDIDGSEIDDLDNEVSNIAKKWTQRHNPGSTQGSKVIENSNSDANLQSSRNEIDVEDIQLQLGDPNQNQRHGDTVKIQENESPPRNKDQQPEDKQKFEERKLFEGVNINTWATRLLKHVLASIKVIGINTNKIPAITNLSHLMNISFDLRKEQIYVEDSLEVNLLLGALLVSSKRNTQAIEVLRNKVQRVYLQQIEINKSKLSNNDGQILSSDEREKLKIQQKKLFSRCAVIELMCAESMCIRPQLNDKLQALVRMTQLCRGQSVQPIAFGGQIFKSDDEYTTIVKILPFLLKFTIACLEYNQRYNKEVIIVSALRNMHFILETQGCSLDSAMVVILKSIFKNYPDKAKHEGIQKRERERLLKTMKENDLATAARSQGHHGTNSLREFQSHFNNQYEMRNIIRYQVHQNSDREGLIVDHQRSEAQIFQARQSMIESLFSCSWLSARNEPTLRKEPNSGFEKTLMNLFNVLLETYVSVLSSISSHILHQIFYEVILPVLINEPFEEDRVRYENLEKEDQQLYFESSCEVKIFAVKIAEKIITICQGDLIVSKTLLDILVKSQSAPSFKKQLEMSSSGEQLRAQMKNLWANIRTKVFTNYSMKGFKQLIDWLVLKMSQLAQNCTILDGKSNISEIAMLELSEDDLVQLSQYLEIITYISVGRRNGQEEANSLIKIKQDFCMDLYLLLNPLLFWLDFSVEREERLNLFKQVYQTIKDVLDNLPPKKVDIDILQIIIPILQRTSEYLRQNSPTQSMLKFLDIVLKDIQAGNFCQTSYPDLQLFFLDMLGSLVDYVSYCLYEDIFPVFEKLLGLCSDILPEAILRKCIIALVDKYTMKSKAQKAAAQNFMKLLIDASLAMEAKDSRSKAVALLDEFNEIEDQEIEIQDPASGKQRRKARDRQPTYFDVMLECCFFKNNDKPAEAAAAMLAHDAASKVEETSVARLKSSRALEVERGLQFKSPQDLHELYVDRLQFFIDSITLLEERHIKLFTALLFNPAFKDCVFRLLERGETTSRLKCHEILETVGTYFVTYCSSKTLYELAIPQSKNVEMMELEFINAERLYIAQMILQCVRKSFEMNSGSDSYLQFNSLILLDYLFQNILPVPTFQNDHLKQRQKLEKQMLQRQRTQQANGNQMHKNDNQFEDGSSGGEGTKHLRMGLNQAEGSRAPERQLNSTYLGELSDAIDLETLTLDGETPEFEVTDSKYTAMRLKCVFKLWPYVQEALNSPWSNIRSICYGLICSMLKMDVRDCSVYLPPLPDSEEAKTSGSAQYVQQCEEQDKELLDQNKFYQKLRQIVIPMMLNLLSSKESESKAGGLNILGSLCGLSYDFSKVKISRNMSFFKRNSEFVSLPIWQLVFDLQDDWDITIKEASIVLVQLCAPREAIQFFNKTKLERENQLFKQMFKKLEKSGGAPGGHGSMSNISSARQNSYYAASRGSHRKHDGGTSSRKGFDWQNFDFGYQNQETPAIPGVLSDHGNKIDMATFLNDNQDLFEIEEDKQPLSYDKEGLIPKSARATDFEGQHIKKSVGDLLQGSKPFALDLDKVKQNAGEGSSLTQRSGFFGNSSQQNQHILMKQQQQNQNLMRAMQGQTSGSKTQLPAHQPFEFFVDAYSDEQIQEIISIFRNDFKPPKNLWIEKQAEGAFFNSPDYYAEIFSGAIEQFNQQQMMLQLKQNQELQDQVSGQGGSALDADQQESPTQQEAEPDKQKTSFSSGEESHYSPPASSSPATSQSDNQPASGSLDGEQIKKSADQAQKQIIDNLNASGTGQTQPDEKASESQDEEAEHQPTSKTAGEPEKVKEKGEEVSKGAPKDEKVHQVSPVKSPEDEKKRYKAVADIKMLEPIDFDAININQEDINQNNQKQSVIPSTESEEDGLAFDSQAPPEFIDTDEEMSSPEQTMQGDKYKDITQLGTGLHIIESNSNEVSGSADNSHQIASFDDAGVGKPNHTTATNEQDCLLDELQRKNNKTLKMIQQEKNKQDPAPLKEMHIEEQREPRGNQYHSLRGQRKVADQKLKYVTSTGRTMNSQESSSQVAENPRKQSKNAVKKQAVAKASVSLDFKVPADGELVSQEFQMKKKHENLQLISGEVNQERLNHVFPPKAEGAGAPRTNKSSTTAVSGKDCQRSAHQKAAKERNLSKSHKQSKKLVNTSNSLPDFQQIGVISAADKSGQNQPFTSQRGGNTKSTERAINEHSQQKHGKKAKKLKFNTNNANDRYRSEIESARVNFASANIPIPPQNNIGNFTHRVPSSGNQAAGMIQSGQTSMKVPKNLMQPSNLSSSNRDYLVMQNISSQILGLQQSNSNSTRGNIFTNDKSQQSVQFQLQPDLQMPPKGKTSMERIINDLQSEESSLALFNNKAKGKKRSTSKQPRAKSAGKKKTLSISPKSKTANEISSLISVGSKAGNQSLNSHSAQSGGNPRTMQANARNLHQQIAQTMNNQQLQQFLVSAQAINKKKINDNVKDLNYFIKTIEKFSKSSGITKEGKRRTQDTGNNPLTISSQHGGPLNSLSAGGTTISAPQTPKDMIQGMLLSLNEQNQRPKKDGKKNRSAHGHKSKSSANTAAGAGGAQKQLYEQLKHQQLQGMTNLAAEQIQQQLMKKGFNLDQLNQILHKVVTNQATSKSESGLRHRAGHGSSSSAGKGQQRERRYTGQTANLGSQKSGLRGSDQSPTSNESSAGPRRGQVYKKELHGHKFGSYSPQNRDHTYKHTTGSQKSHGRVDESSANSKSQASAQHKKKLKNKHPSFNLAPPPQLNNLMNLNYSQTQKLDLREINQQFLSHDVHKYAGSTQNKNSMNMVMLNQNSSQNSAVNFQGQQHKDWLRDKSAKSTGSAKSTTGGVQAQSAQFVAQHVVQPGQNQQFVFKQQQQPNKHSQGIPSQYNNLLLANGGKNKSSHQKKSADYTSGSRPPAPTQDAHKQQSRGGSQNQLSLSHHTAQNAATSSSHQMGGNLPLSPKNTVDYSNSKSSRPQGGKSSKMPVSARSVGQHGLVRSAKYPLAGHQVHDSTGASKTPNKNI